MPLDNDKRRRRKNDSKSEALTKIRKYKESGEKFKYEFEEEESVYRYVDEETYEKDVSEYNAKSWIVGEEKNYQDDHCTQNEKIKNDDTRILPKNTPSVAPLRNLFARKLKQPKTQQNTQQALLDLDNDAIFNDILKDLDDCADISEVKPLIAKKNENVTKVAENVGWDKPRMASVETRISGIDSGKKTYEVEEVLTVEDGLNRPFSFEFSDLSNDFGDLNVSEAGFNFSDANMKSVEDILAASVVNVNAPLLKLDGVSNFQIYWLDIAQSKTQYNSLFLFGKMKIDEQLVSCMCRVKNIPNQFWILKNESVSFNELYAELKSILQDAGIFEFKCKDVRMRYPFSSDTHSAVTNETDFLQVLCMNAHKLSDTVKGRTFTMVIGLRKSLCEYFLVTTKMKGPCWVDVKNGQKVGAKVSHCKVEMEVDSMHCISYVLNQPPSPLLTVASLCLYTHGKSNVQQIIGVALITQSHVNMDATTNVTTASTANFLICPPVNGPGFPPDFVEYTKKRNFAVDMTSSQKSLLTLLFTKLMKLDPDVIVGHDLFEYVLKYLIHVADEQDVHIWNMIGRLKQNNPSKNVKFHEYTSAASGRLMVDLKTLAEELVKYQTYSMSELCAQLLKVQRVSYECANINQIFTQSAPLFDLIETLLKDGMYCLRIMNALNVLPLFHQIAQICGQPMGRSLTLGRAERVEFLLVHGFTESNCICVDKGKKESKNAHAKIGIKEGVSTLGEKKKSSYSGGLVLEPKVGYYSEYVLLFDYMSLYPSLIQQFNICFTTMKFEKVDGEVRAVPIEGLDAHMQGVIPKEIKKIVDRRRQVKILMQTTDTTSTDYAQLEIRQRALKLIANSIYGCLGYPHARFYGRPLAAYVTAKGRELLGCTRDIVEGLGYEVIYGDTDSIMVNTKTNEYSKISDISHRVITAVNKNYRNLKIELDRVYKPMLLLKKKKYAAVSHVKTPQGGFCKKREIKGLDIIRHDWSVIAKESGERVLDLILDCNNHDTLIERVEEFLSETAEKLRRNEFRMEKFVIRRKLAKQVHEYPDNTNFSQVLVAKRLVRQGKNITVGDTVEYIVCCDCTTNTHAQRSYHLSELQQHQYTIDTKYYLEFQLFPVISRLCNHIDGLDSYFIANCLKMKDNKIPSKMTHIQNMCDAEKLPIFCATCSSYFDLESLISSANSCRFCCANCNIKISGNKLMNAVDAVIYRTCREYYLNILICTNLDCKFEGQLHVSLLSLDDGFRCKCGNGQMKQKMSSLRLYQQMQYLHDLLDRSIATIKYSESALLKNIIAFFDAIERDENLSSTLRYLCCKLDYILKNSAYSNVNLGDIFTTN